jgi:hypothetical protein
MVGNMQIGLRQAKILQALEMVELSLKELLIFFASR